MSRIKRIIGGIGGVILLLSLAGALYQVIATKIDVQRYPPPGEFVDIGGYRLHVKMSGQGDIPVIMEAGGGGCLLNWHLVEPDVAQFARVLIYDRAGYGWSDPGPKPRTPAQTVTELKALLHHANIPGPYVFVGSSFGGIVLRLYANRYPDDVAGMVLADAGYEGQQPRRTGLAGTSFRSRVHRRITLVTTYLGITRLLSLFRPQFSSVEPQEIRSVYTALRLQTTYVTAVLELMAGAEEGFQQLRTGENLLGDTPLIVLTAGRNLTQTWKDIQQELAQKSTNSRHIIAEGSGHSIQFERPDLVITAIHDVAECVSTNCDLTAQ